MKAKWLSFAFTSFHEFLRIETFQRVTSEKKSFSGFNSPIGLCASASNACRLPLSPRAGNAQGSVLSLGICITRISAFAKPIRDADRARPDWFLGERQPGGRGRGRRLSNRNFSSDRPK